MLALDSILWVVPGFVFTIVYNKKRPSKAINLSGWPYVFTLVLIAVFTWLPIKTLITDSFGKSLCPTLLTVFLSILASSILAILYLRLSIKFAWMAPSIHDTFCNQCIEWENKLVIVTLRNNKAYNGILLRYPESPKEIHESHGISIVPIESGFVNKEKKIIWHTKYPTDNEKQIATEIVIHRSDVVTFRKFNKELYQNFYQTE